MNILGIETSCDETGIAIYAKDKGLVANQLHSQVALHNPYGGVVPELASRDHIRKILPLLHAALAQAKLRLSDIDGVAYTAGPGLIGAVLVGAAFGRSLGMSLGVPTLGIHHLEGHLLAALLKKPAPTFPFLVLLVSGGHTLLIHAYQLGDYQILGETIDDAVGEAFDKTAKILGLGYPGGKALADLATQGDANHYQFPRPMTDRPGLDFSFSGLKTYALNTFNKSAQDTQSKANVAAAFEKAVAETLTIKCKRALNQTGLSCLVIAGGVGANQTLRMHLKKLAAKLNIDVFYPRIEFCTDNAAMIAFAGSQRLQASQAGASQTDNLTIQARARWSLEDLKALV